MPGRDARGGAQRLAEGFRFVPQQQPAAGSDTGGMVVVIGSSSHSLASIFAFVFYLKLVV